SQASLLAKMEQEQIGTKATRADIIATLFKREYLAQEKGGTMVRATDLGLAVVESMKERVPAIVSTALTRSMEEQLEKVEEGEQDPAAVVEYAAEKLVESLAAFRKNRTEIGRQIRQEMGGGEGGNGDIAAAAQQQATVIGRCPLCKTGSLRMIRSKTTKKRFVGCSNYSPSTSTSAGAAGGGGGGCRASAPLPQKGTVRSYGKVCSCGWPIVWVAFGRGKKWNMCVNVQCPHKKKAGS
ncbi:MAG: DNA topoisomerase, partial [Thermoproteota archaeon]